MRRYASDICRIEYLQGLISLDNLDIIDDIRREPNCRYAQIYLKMPTNFEKEYKPFLQRIVSIIEELGPLEVTYETETNSLSMYWD